MVTKDIAYGIWNKWKKDNKKIYRSLLTKCATCNGNEFLGIHHKDRDKTNNKVSNFVCLCFTCHRKLHNKIGCIRYEKEVHYYTPSVEKKLTVEELLKMYEWNGSRWCLKG